MAAPIPIQAGMHLYGPFDNIQANYTNRLLIMAQDKNWTSIAMLVANAALALFASSVLVQSIGVVGFIGTAAAISFKQFMEHETAQKLFKALNCITDPSFSYAMRDREELPRLNSPEAVIKLAEEFYEQDR